jgi:hypothetical protein
MKLYSQFLWPCVGRRFYQDADLTIGKSDLGYLLNKWDQDFKLPTIALREALSYQIASHAKITPIVMAGRNNSG